MQYIAKTSKVQKNKLIQAKQGTQACYVITNLANLNYKSKICNTKHILPNPSFQSFFFFFNNFERKKQKTT